MIDGIYHRSVRYSRSLLRRETYRLLEKEKKTLNAERIYKILKEEFLKEKELAQLEKEFYVDDHKYWANQQPDRKPNPLMSKNGEISAKELRQIWRPFPGRQERRTEIFWIS